MARDLSREPQASRHVKHAACWTGLMCPKFLITLAFVMMLTLTVGRRSVEVTKLEDNRATKILDWSENGDQLIGDKHPVLNASTELTSPDDANVVREALKKLDKESFKYDPTVEQRMTHLILENDLSGPGTAWLFELKSLRQGSASQMLKEVYPKIENCFNQLREKNTETLVLEDFNCVFYLIIAYDKEKVLEDADPTRILPEIALLPLLKAAFVEAQLTSSRGFTKEDVKNNVKNVLPGNVLHFPKYKVCDSFDSLWEVGVINRMDALLKLLKEEKYTYKKFSADLLAIYKKDVGVDSERVCPSPNKARCFELTELQEAEGCNSVQIYNDYINFHGSLPHGITLNVKFENSTNNSDKLLQLFYSYVDKELLKGTGNVLVQDKTHLNNLWKLRLVDEDRLDVLKQLVGNDTWSGISGNRARLVVSYYGFLRMKPNKLNLLPEEKAIFRKLIEKKLISLQNQNRIIYIEHGPTNKSLFENLENETVIFQLYNLMTTYSPAIPTVNQNYCRSFLEDILKNYRHPETLYAGLGPNQGEYPIADASLTQPAFLIIRKGLVDCTLYDTFVTNIADKLQGSKLVYFNPRSEKFESAPDNGGISKGFSLSCAVNSPTPAMRTSIKGPVIVGRESLAEGPDTGLRTLENLTPANEDPAVSPENESWHSCGEIQTWKVYLSLAERLKCVKDFYSLVVKLAGAVS